MVYRSRLDIFASIVNAVDTGRTEGTGITTIMYKSQISHYQLKSYMSYVLARGLLKQVGASKTYVITPTGKKFLALMRDLYKYINTNDYAKFVGSTRRTVIEPTIT